MYEDKTVRSFDSAAVGVLRLFIVADHQMITDALGARLSDSPGLWVAGCATTDDPKLPEIVRGLRPDVIIIDVEPLGFAIGEVLRRLGAAWPAARVVVIGSGRNIHQAVAAARSGAAAWVSKEQGADDLETAVRGVCSGLAWFPAEMLGEILRELREDVNRARGHSDPLNLLSPGNARS